MIKPLSQKDIELKNARVPRPAILFISQNLKGPLVGVEIGVQLGKNAESMLQILNIKKLYLIDPYIHYKKNIHHIAQNFPSQLTRAIQKLSPFKDKIVWVKKKSSDALNSIPDNLDFVYIDGNHTYPYVKADIENYWPKIKKGGVLAGHDYFLNTLLIRGRVVGGLEVKKAVDEFVKKHNINLNVKAPDWWVVK
ncbi:unnamed protein product [marine sediment metagenome]|uniref:Methyltransferase domain-containing protein n=1 Tax=marine sediment metagenome TaxID=412755 RepID=X1KBS2_9ZZZZ